MKQKLTITEEQGIVRIDKFFALQFSEYSRAAIAKLFTLKLIKREDGTPYKPGEKVRPGTTIEYDLGPLQAAPEVIPLPVLFEDDNVIVVNKPTGIISHARGRFWQEASVASFIRDKVSGSLVASKKDAGTSNSAPPAPDRAGIVHRLDRATSGVMICAKNIDTLRYLQKQFHDREVTKTYIAIVKDGLTHPEAIIDAPIMRNLKDPKRFMVHPDGKPSKTSYTTMKVTNGYTQVELTPKTGRTHQLRLHMLHIGKVIVGDDLYEGEESSRLMLHAHSLTIRLPGGTETTFTSPLPVEFSKLMDTSSDEK